MQLGPRLGSPPLLATYWRIRLLRVFAARSASAFVEWCIRCRRVEERFAEAFPIIAVPESQSTRHEHVSLGLNDIGR